MSTFEHRLSARRSGWKYYTSRSLACYDAVVLGFNNKYVWRCPTTEIERLFAEYATPVHCDVGVGTGYFLNKIHSSRPFEKLHLIDASSEALMWASRNCKGASPTWTCADITEPIHWTGPRFRSISVNYLIHCLSGPLERKEKMFRNFRRIAAEGAFIFGSTVLNDRRHQAFLANLLLPILNVAKAFDTREDSEDAIRSMLGRNLDDMSWKVRGSVGVFDGRLNTPSAAGAGIVS